MDVQKIENIEQNLMEHNFLYKELVDDIKDIKTDLKDIKTNYQQVNNLCIKLDYTDKAVDRAFAKLSELEKFKVETEAKFNKFEGLKIFAFILWSVLGSGVAASIFKLFVQQH